MREASGYVLCSCWDEKENSVCDTSVVQVQACWVLSWITIAAGPLFLVHSGGGKREKGKEEEQIPRRLENGQNFEVNFPIWYVFEMLA